MNLLSGKVSLLEIGTVWLLGSLFGLGPSLLLNGIVDIPLPMIYIGSISVAHMGEYLFVCGYHPDILEWDSFLIFYSPDYVLAHCFAVVEYTVELLYVPQWCKIDVPFLPALGLTMIVVGHFFRLGAMFTAAQSFHHTVQQKKAASHTLVTSGVY